MAFEPLPRSAAWRHVEARDGFEAAFFSTDGETTRLRGSTAAVEDGQAWAVDYAIALDRDWRTLSARIQAISADGEREVTVEADGPGRWRVDGVARPDLDGCADVDLESSACTNTVPVHRLGLRAGEEADAPAAYVRAPGLQVERLDQRYRRLDDSDGRQRYDYRSPRFDYQDVLTFDASGLALDYPGLARRIR